MANKIVEIHRQYTFAEEANRDPQVKEYFDMTYRAIGAYPRIVGKIPESGLTHKEEQILMPGLVGYEHTDRDFRKEVNNFFNNINTRVPAEGLKLNIGLEDDSMPLSTNNYPINIEQYVRYRHALKNPQVGKNREEAERYQHIKFYIVDQAEETLTASKMLAVEDEAQIRYLEIRKDPRKVEMVLTLLNIDTRNMSNDDMMLELKRQSSSDPNQPDTMNEQKLDRFIKICKDRDMQVKYDIFQMISVGVLERVSRKILDKETGVILGNNLRETVLYFRDKANAKQVNYYMAELDERRRKESKQPIVPESDIHEEEEEVNEAPVATKTKPKKASKTSAKKKTEEESPIGEYDENASMADFEVNDDEN
jgi:hypothetical protein